MWNDLVHLQVPAIELVVRGAVVYFAVLILLRIAGKKQIGQMGATEFVAILMISNAVQNSMNGGDNSLVGGLILAAVLIASSSVISYLTYKSKFFTRLFEGTPTLLIHKGKIVGANLARERLRVSELRSLLRKQGIDDVQEVETAVLESDGTFSIIKREEHPPVYS